MVFLKLVHSKSQVNHKTQPFWVKVVHLVPNAQILAGHAVGTFHLVPTTTLHFHFVLKTKFLFLHWIFIFFAKIRLIEITNILMWCQWQLIWAKWWCQNASKVVPFTLIIFWTFLLCYTLIRKSHLFRSLEYPPKMRCLRFIATSQRLWPHSVRITATAEGWSIQDEAGGYQQQRKWIFWIWRLFVTSLENF